MYKKSGVRGKILLLCFVLFFGTLVSWAPQTAFAGSELLSEIPPYSGSAYVEINGNIPEFDETDLTAESFEYYSDLDELGRCGAAFANVGTDLMPTQSRGDISSVHPSGWVQHEYDTIEGGVLYNRCHLINYEMTGENDNEKNLITGTRYFNTDGMLPFEDRVLAYIEKTGNHVLYRVTPLFEGDDLVARGVQMEAMSVEDDGAGILFNVFCYNVQPGITIDYATGENWEEENQESEQETAEEDGTSGQTYILNINTGKFHDPSCSSVNDIREWNRREFTGDRETLIEEGYEPCKRCNP